MRIEDTYPNLVTVGDGEMGVVPARLMIVRHTECSSHC